MNRHETIATPDVDGLSERDLRHIRRSLDRPQRLVRGATLLGGAAIVAASILQADIAFSKQRLSDTEPRIHAISEAIDPEQRDHTTIYIDGFAGNDGSDITRAMTPAMQQLHDGNTAALEYDRAGISVPNIAAHIAEHATENDLSSVALHGYSIGGMITLETAALLQEQHHIRVSHIILDQTPADADTIKSTVRDSGTAIFVDAIGTSKSLGFDIEYSSIARGTVDLIAPDHTSHLKDSTVKLMRDQFMYGTTVDTDAMLSRVSEHAVIKPTLVYVTSTTPENDYMVELSEAETKYQTAAETYGFEFMRVPVEEAIHSRPDLTLEAYETAFAEASSNLEIADAASLETAMREPLLSESLRRAAAPAIPHPAQIDTK